MRCAKSGMIPKGNVVESEISAFGGIHESRVKGAYVVDHNKVLPLTVTGGGVREADGVLYYRQADGTMGEALEFITNKNFVSPKVVDTVPTNFPRRMSASLGAQLDLKHAKEIGEAIIAKGRNFWKSAGKGK